MSDVGKKLIKVYKERFVWGGRLFDKPVADLTIGQKCNKKVGVGNTCGQNQ